MGFLWREKKRGGNRDMFVGCIVEIGWKIDDVNGKVQVVDFLVI